MREAFRRDMRLMWPNGPASAHQHRDIVRVFAMGWCDALMAVGAKEAVEAFVREFASISDPNWWPGESWVWWE